MSMNGYDDTTYQAIAATAVNLADIFEEYSEEGLCSEEGLEMLGDFFGDIKEDFRGEVFQHLLVELEERGIDYDIEQFKEDE